MIPNMWLAGAPISASIVASGVAGEHAPDAVLAPPFAPACEGRAQAPGVSVRRHGDRRELRCEHGEVRGGRLVGGAAPRMVNLFSQTSWALSNVRGRARGQRDRRAARHRVVRHDLDLHLPSVYAEDHSGQRSRSRRCHDRRVFMQGSRVLRSGDSRSERACGRGGGAWSFIGSEGARLNESMGWPELSHRVRVLRGHDARLPCGASVRCSKARSCPRASSQRARIHPPCGVRGSRCERPAYAWNVRCGSLAGCGASAHSRRSWSLVAS